MTEYNKLVRDEIPKIIEARGDECKIHIAEDPEYQEKLNEKLLEEVKEFLDSKNPEDRKEELADILEVINAICEFHGFNKYEIEQTRKEKCEKKGGFSQKIILEES